MSIYSTGAPVMIYFKLWNCVKVFYPLPSWTLTLPSSSFLLLLFCSVGASPSPARHSGSAPATIWPQTVIWNSHTLEVDTAGAISQHSRGVWGGSCKVVVLVVVAGELLAQTLAAFRGNTWQITDLIGKKWQHSHVCECSDCYWLTTCLGDLWKGQSEDGGRAHWAFIPFSVPVCLPYLFLSLPGREWLLAGSQAESKRMILFKKVGASFGLRLYRPLWWKEECWWVFGGGVYNSCTVWLLLWQKDVMWTGALRREWKACVMCQICSERENGSH